MPSMEGGGVENIIIIANYLAENLKIIFNNF